MKTRSSRGIILLSLLGSALAATAALPAVAEVARSSQPLRGRIVFTRAGGRYGAGTVFVANANGTRQRRLSAFGATCCPRISRDGKRVLFAATTAGGRTTTATIATNGTGYRKLVLPPGLNLGPGAWTPDGSQIAFRGWDLHDHALDGIYIGSSTQDRGWHRATIGHHDLPGDFSPDATRLAFFRERPKLKGVGSVWVVNLRTNVVRQVTPASMTVGFGTVRWSPDGTRILFASGRTAKKGALWTVHPNGSDLRRVFKAKNGFPIAPTWSPDGARIMFALDPIADDTRHPPNSLDVINENGTGLTRVIGGRNFKSQPDWVK